MNVLFDLDGTLTDPKDGIIRSVCFALEKMGVEPPLPDSLEWLIGPPLQGSLATLLGTEDARAPAECLKHYRERFSEVGLFENAVYDDIPTALETLRSTNFRLFVATSKPTIYSGRILEHFGLSPYFEGIFGSELDGTRADKTELICHLLASADLEREDTIMVGDRKHDMIGAKGNGLKSIGVTYGYGSKEELEEAGADWLASTPGVIVEVLLGLLAGESKG